MAAKPNDDGAQTLHDASMHGVASAILTTMRANMEKVWKAMEEDPSCMVATVFAGQVDQDYVGATMKVGATEVVAKNAAPTVVQGVGQGVASGEADDGASTKPTSKRTRKAADANQSPELPPTAANWRAVKPAVYDVLLQNISHKEGLPNAWGLLMNYRRQVGAELHRASQPGAHVDRILALKSEALNGIEAKACMYGLRLVYASKMPKMYLDYRKGTALAMICTERYKMVGKPLERFFEAIRSDPTFTDPDAIFDNLGYWRLKEVEDPADSAKKIKVVHCEAMNQSLTYASSYKNLTFGSNCFYNSTEITDNETRAKFYPRSDLLAMHGKDMGTLDIEWGTVQVPFLAKDCAVTMEAKFTAKDRAKGKETIDFATSFTPVQIPGMGVGLSGGTSTSAGSAASGNVSVPTSAGALGKTSPQKGDDPPSAEEEKESLRALRALQEKEQKEEKEKKEKEAEKEKEKKKKEENEEEEEPETQAPGEGEGDDEGEPEGPPGPI